MRITIEDTDGECIEVYTNHLEYPEVMNKLIRTMEVLFGYRFDIEKIVDTYDSTVIDKLSADAFNEGFKQAVEQINDDLSKYGLQSDGNEVVPTATPESGGRSLWPDSPAGRQVDVAKQEEVANQGASEWTGHLREQGYEDCLDDYTDYSRSEGPRS